MGGCRLAVHIETSRVRILTRNEQDWTHPFPSIEEEARGLVPSTMIPDGEAVVFNV